MKIKKLLALVLSLILAFSCVSVIPFTAVADDAATVASDIETKKRYTLALQAVKNELPTFSTD